ncbi:ApaG domain [Oscillatoria amoena NRMC-F 0135]|nr:ApaG domain [Oscillatoria amoena NRMC-F 0135]
MTEPIEPDNLRVTVDRVVYAPQLQAPPDKPHPFIYFITIHNHSDHAITIKGRKWVVTDETGDKLVVEGDGVVGQTPTIGPGESFSYNSYHTIGHDSIAEGAYLGTDDQGRAIVVRIPKFHLRLP